MRLPNWMLVSAWIAALLQPIVVILLLRSIYHAVRKTIQQKGLQQLWLLSLFAFCIKILLQSLSVVPGLSSYAFAYRPVVIGYLHLVLLGFVSLFLLGWMMDKKILPMQDGRLSGWCWLFISGILLTELTLMAQGITAMFYWAIPHTNEMLLLAALFLVFGIAGMNWASRRAAVSGFPISVARPHAR
jgi:hypothetical protein